MKRVGFVGLLVYATAFVTPTAAALFRVWVNQDAVQAGYRLSAASSKKRELEGTIRQLEVELAAERAPGRLLSLAAELGMTPVAPENIFGAGERGGGRGP